MQYTGKRPGLSSFDGKVVVITGASSGVGRAAAAEFASQGATVILAARREDALRDVARECINVGGRALPVPTDVTEAQSVVALVEAAVQFAGKIDVWVNNAGVLAAGEFTETPIAVLDRVIQTNLLGYIHGAHAVLPYFKKQAYGILINNISVGAWFPTPFATGYTASKFGLKGFSEALRGELITYPNVHICDLFPAFLDTPGISHAANYTGKVLMPAPPVFDPKRVAKAMVRLAVHPKNKTTTDLMAPALKLAHSVFPGIARTLTAGFIGTYLKTADKASTTPGNLFVPVEEGTGVYGGWQPKLLKKMAKAATIGVVISAALLTARSLR